MKKLLTAACFASIFLTFGSPSNAQTGNYVSGDHLYQVCQQKPDSVEGALCTGYIVAIADVMDRDAISDWSSCVPRGVKGGQLRKVVTLWLKNNPDSHEYTASSVAANALAEAYPCETVSNKGNK